MQKGTVLKMNSLNLTMITILRLLVSLNLEGIVLTAWVQNTQAMQDLQALKRMVALLT